MTEPTPALLVLLAAALALTAWLVSPFADALLVASVVAVLAWPVHRRILGVVGGRRGSATALSMLAVTLGVLVPAGLLVWLVSRELIAVINLLATELDQGGLDAQLEALRAVPIVDRGIERFGGAVLIAEEIHQFGRETLANLGSLLGGIVPGVLGFTAVAFLKITIFFLTLGTLFQSGERLVDRTVRISPLRTATTTRLLDIFAQFARNVVLAGLASALVQGGVAGIGYLLAGVERPLFFALLTALMAFVPLVGTAVAWVPVTLLLLLHGHPASAVFVVIWSLLLTGTIDNIVKPLVMRGRSQMPTLLVFLGVFGGLLAFGLIGFLVGPVLIAMMLALLHIYEESLPPEEPVARPDTEASHPRDAG